MADISAQLASIKSQALKIQSQLNSKVAAEKTSSSSSSKVVGGGASPELTALSIALAQGKAVPKGVKKDVKDSKGNVTGSVDVGGTVQSSRSTTLDPSVQRQLDAEDAAATSAAKAAIAPPQQSGGNALGKAEANPYAQASFSVPTFDQNRYQSNADFFSKMFNPGATANTTSMYGNNKDGMAAGGGAGGGGGTTWGDGSGQYTPGISGDGQALTATRNQGVQSPAPTDKAQATAAGVPDTSGQSAANSAPNGNSQLMKSLQQLSAALSTLDLGALTGTADGVDNAVNNVDSALSKAYESALADMPDYKKMQQDAKDLFDLKADLIDKRQQQLEDRYEADKDSINADAAIQKDELKDSQKSQTGKLAGGLASAGAYLGFDNVNHSAMLSLQVTHDREMTVLGQAKIAALSEARRAFEDADFALLTEHVNAIDSYDKKITDLANTHFTQTLQMTQEARNNVKFMQDTETFERNKGFTNIDTIVEAGTMPTENDIQQYAKTFGLSVDDVRGYITNKRNSLELEKTQKKTEGELAIYRVLSGIDKGQYITIGGKTYEGLNVPAKSGTSSSSSLSYEDVFKDFNNSPIARSMVGMSKDSVYQLLGSENPPEEMSKMISDGIPDLDADPEKAKVQVQMAWENMSKDALGLVKSQDLQAFDYDDQNAIVQEINTQREEQARAEGKTNVQLLNTRDLDNPNQYPYELLNQYLRMAGQRDKEESGGSLVSDLSKVWGNQGTLGTLNK